MVKPIKQPKPTGIPAIPLPFPPTDTPEHAHIFEAAKSILMLAQVCFNGNPGPVITALKAAENTYIENAEKNGGMDVDAIEQFEVLGVAISKILLEQLDKEREKAESGIVTPDTGLVGPDGRPIVSDALSGTPDKIILNDNHKE
jgi:hypothetical protein